jgi:hypothetical protein
MKGNLSLSFLLFAAFFLFSCKKESFSELSGKWESVSVYTELNNGSYGWVNTEGHRHSYEFFPDGRFSAFSDVPVGAGTYIYNKTTGELLLNYEADQYGTFPRTEKILIERMGKANLTVSHLQDRPFKIEYERVND